MDSTEQDDDDTPDGEVGDLPKKLRSEIKARDKALAEERTQRETIEAERKEFRRDKVFEEAGIPTDGTGLLLRESFASTDDLTADAVREKAIATGVLSGPVPEAGAGEIAAHAAIQAVAGQAPAAEPDLNTRMGNAQTQEELVRIITEAGGIVS